MTDEEFRLPLVFNYVATLSWAFSGAVVAIRKRFDIVGVFVVALLSSTGGSLLRDAFFVQRTPQLLTDPVYLPLIMATTVLASFFARPLIRVLSGQKARKLVDITDAVGIPCFSIVGMQLAQHVGISLAGALLVGMANGVGGGLIRDVTVREVPALLRPGQFVALFLLFWCGLFLLLTRKWGMSASDAGWITVAGFFVLRALAIHYNWQSRAVMDAKETETNGDAEDAGD